MTTVKETMKNTKASLVNMRLTGIDNLYHANQLIAFASYICTDEKWADKELTHIEFGKQDTRGAVSITAYNSDHCVPFQRHFSSKDGLLGYVQGFNAAYTEQEYL